jgi:hypothetical protein
MSQPQSRLVVRPEEVTIPEGHPLRRLPVIGAAAGLLGTIAALLIGAGRSQQLAFSWLVAFLFFLSLALGALYFVLIQYAVQAGWGIVVRRLAETTAATIPLFALLFVPVLLGMRELYPWSVAGAADHDRLLAWKAPFLNVPFFLARAAIYFVVWSVVALVWYRASRRQDETGDLGITRRLRQFSGPALFAVALTQTFAAFDWIMSLTPHWYSTVFGVYVFAGAFVAFNALLALAVVALQGAGLLRDVIGVGHLHDLGKMVFAFTCFWAYIAFSQYFLMWYGNIPEETVWYRVRMTGSWKTASILLALGHFIVPFLLLMGRTLKRRPFALGAGAAWVLLMHFVDIYWLVMPALHADGIRFGLADLAALLAVGGWFVAAGGWLMRRQPLVPLKDPRIAESLSLTNA